MVLSPNHENKIFAGHPVLILSEVYNGVVLPMMHASTVRLLVTARASCPSEVGSTLGFSQSLHDGFPELAVPIMYRLLGYV